MRIVRLVRGLRVLLALAVVSVVFVLPSRPAGAVTVFAGECVVSNLQFGGALTPTTVGGWSERFDFSNAPCIYTSHLSTSMSGSGSVSGTVGPCGVGVLQGSNYQVDTAGLRFFGKINLVNEGATLSVAFVSNTLEFAFAGELVPTGLNANKCPTGWTGVLVVEDPKLEE